MKMILTLIPINLVTNCLYISFSSYEPKTRTMFFGSW